MSNKKEVRVFLLKCCKLIKTFTFDDFAHDGNMTLICHKHPEPVVRYITWRSGLNKEEYDKFMEKYKKSKADAKILPPLA
jgi:hypothetical protein